MTKIAIVLDGEQIYPIIRHEGAYHIDFGGAVGLSAPMHFERDTEAINWFRKVMQGNQAHVVPTKDCPAAALGA